MGTKRYVYDQFAEIVTATATRSGKTCYYQFGHPKEIIENLRAMTRDPLQTDNKYPLIALFADYPEKQGETPNIASRVSLHLIIATLTLKEYSAMERAEINFQATLNPIFDALMISIAKSGYYLTQGPDSIPREKIERYFWGRNGLYVEPGNVFEDLIDCIEIKDLELSVFKHFNC